MVFMQCHLQQVWHRIIYITSWNVLLPLFIQVCIAKGLLGSVFVPAQGRIQNLHCRGGGTSDQWSRRLHWGAKRRKGEGGGGGDPFPQVGVRGPPPEFFWEITWKWCILSAFWGNQYTFFALKIYMKKMSLTKFTSRLFIFFKILGNILIERIRKAIDKELRKEQAGFRKGKGTSDQIFILRNIIEQSVEWQAPLYLNFIDFEKAFDSIHRETLWKIMELYGVPSKISTVIKRLYQNNEICVTNNGLQSDWVRIESGVKQGCGMSGFLFLLVLDWVMRNSVQGKNTGIRWKFMSKLEDLDFADDIALISSKFNDIQDKTTSVKEWAEKAGLKINIGKTKSMRLNTKIDRPLRIDGQELEDVDQFTYLGSKVTKEGGASEDIKSRLQKARSAFLSLNQVWKSSLYSVKTKLKIYNSNVKSVLMYGSECWKMTVADIKKCEAFNNRCLRRIIRVFWPNKISNIELRERTKTQTIEESIRLRRWRCIGHVLRKGNEEDQKVALSWTPEGKRRRGRPRETWRRTVERERNLFGWPSWRAAEDIARDRPRWRDLCLALCSTRSEEDR